MELRAFAEQILYSDDLTIKITRITESLTDSGAGAAVRVTQPTRPAKLQFAERTTAVQPSSRGRSTIRETWRESTRLVSMPL